MYLTAQRVISPSGENGINGFLYEHGTVTWEKPPEPIKNAIGELVHTFIMVTPGNNQVMSYVDVIAPDNTPYARIRERIFPWFSAQACAQQPLPWTGIVEDMRFGLHMTAAYAKAWKSEVTKLIAVCQLTLDRCTLPAIEESNP